MESRGEPKGGAERARAVRIRGSLAAPDHPASAARLDAGFDQSVPGEPAQSLEVTANAYLSASDTHQISRPTSAERRNQAAQQSTGTRLTAIVRPYCYLHSRDAH